ncbi:putative RNA-directed DNA polymerase [Tanacetum coccineum]|uniref:RNA-directed DNA polymerase n=1 Tax=Tanacetum coccineum TaxID=301880 RepID=A0ABQ5A6F1_9ASTR
MSRNNARKINTRSNAQLLTNNSTSYLLVETSREAWERLNSSYASSSRSRIISLKSKLTKNPKGTRSVAEFLHEMRSIADELALAQSPIQEEDLIVHILSQLRDEVNNIVAAIKVRESVISFSEFFEKLRLSLFFQMLYIFICKPCLQKKSYI